MAVEVRVDAPCEACGGRGWLVEPDGGAGSARPCECRGTVDLPRLLEEARIPPRYRRCTLESFNTSDPGARDVLLEAKVRSQHYVDEFIGADGGFRESGLLFLGPPGSGKTHLATAVLSELVRRYRVRGLFVDFTSLIYEIQSTFDPGAAFSKHHVLEPVMDCDVLVLDELGAQKPTAWVSELLYLILNRRYTERRATLFTTNCRIDAGRTRDTSPDGALAARPLLSHRIPASLVSRLWEMAQPVSIEAPDYRHEVMHSVLAHRRAPRE